MTVPAVVDVEAMAKDLDHLANVLSMEYGDINPSALRHMRNSAALIRQQAKQIEELQNEREEILRVSGLVWPPTTSEPPQS